MSTFTIRQVGESITKDAFYIPNAVGCTTELTPVGEANNWECVDDPIGFADDDTTYVHSKATNEKHDLYNLPNHTTESGTINYIQVYGRTKSQHYTQHIDGIFKIILTENNCINIYKSNDIDLLTSYITYDNTWNTNPRTTDAWVWSDIDNLQIGTECSSPTIIGTDQSEYHLPLGNGFYDQLIKVPSGYPAYTVVDDPLGNPDGWDTYIKSKVGGGYNTFTFTSSLGASDFIDSVSVYAVVGTNTGGSGTAGCLLLIRYLAANYSGSDYLYGGDSSWETISDTFTATDLGNPTMNGTDLADMEFGIWMFHLSSRWLACTQIYLKVNYHTSANPEIRTTQCYVKVNYDVDPVSCELDKPQTISIDHDQNIKMLNFWSGRRAVYGLSRNNRTMVMNGMLYSETACDTIECIRGIGEDGLTVSLSGLGSNNYDKECKILSFGWKKISNKPLAYTYLLELEFAQ